MTAEQLQIAIDRVNSPAAGKLLEKIRPLFERVCELDRTFISRINASKAARGEAPTKLRKPRREDVAHLAEDARNGETQLTEDFRHMPGEAVVEALASGLDTDLRMFAPILLKHAHPADRPIVEECVEAKRELHAKLEAFLTQFPAPDEDDS